MQLNYLPGLLTLLFIPVLILLHSMRRKPVEKQVTALFIWEKVMQEQKHAVFFQALLKNVSLLLQILVILLLALALSNPSVFLNKDMAKRVIIVLDTSAGMKALENGTSRFETALAAVQEKMNTLGRQDRAMLVNCGPSPSVVHSFTTDKASLRKRLGQMKTTDAPADTEKAVSLAISFLSGNGTDQIWLFADRSDESIDALTDLHPAIVPVRIGKPLSNVGITGFDIRQISGRKNELEIYIRIENFGNQPVIFPLKIKTGSGQIVSRQIGLDRHQAKAFVFEHKGSSSGIITAEIEIEDGLSADNKVWAGQPLMVKKNIFLVTKGNYFLETLLAVFPDCRVATSPAVPLETWHNICERNDIVILDQVPLPAKSHGNFLLINSFAPDLPISAKGVADAPEIIDWQKDSPIMKGINPKGMYIETATKVTGDDTTLVLLESDRTPLILQHYTDRTKLVFFAFNPEQSDLPLRVAFPVLIRNIFQWLDPQSSAFMSTHIRTGQPIVVDVKKDNTVVAIRKPSQKWDRIMVNKGPFLYSKTHEAGVYRVRVDSESRFVAVNLLDEKESDLTGPERLKEKKQHSTRVGPLGRKTQTHVWGGITMLILMVFFAEIWVRFKRSRQI